MSSTDKSQGTTSTDLSQTSGSQQTQERTAEQLFSQLWDYLRRGQIDEIADICTTDFRDIS